MSIAIRNDSHPTADGRWDWSVWLVADEEAELDRVSSVAWHLHPTFPNPIRRIYERETGFRLSANGWGTFEIAAVLYDELDEPSRPIKHQLEFGEGSGDDEPNGGGDDEVTKDIFLSYNLADSAAAEEVGQQLAAAGFNVRSSGDVTAESVESWSGWLHEHVRSADAIVVVGDKHSLWQDYEVEAARSAGLQVFELESRLVHGSDAELTGPSSDDLATFIEGINDTFGEASA